MLLKLARWAFLAEPKQRHSLCSSFRQNNFIMCLKSGMKDKQTSLMTTTQRGLARGMNPNSKSLSVPPIRLLMCRLLHVCRSLTPLHFVISPSHRYLRPHLHLAELWDYGIILSSNEDDYKVGKTRNPKLLPMGLAVPCMAAATHWCVIVSVHSPFTIKFI